MTTSIGSEAFKNIRKIYGKHRVEKEIANKRKKNHKPFNNYNFFLHLCFLQPKRQTNGKNIQRIDDYI